MVTTDVAQYSRECNAWRESLRSFRNEFSQFRNQLQEIAGRQTQRDVLLEVEHLHNQFHIQLINIHDLKQAIKAHERQLSQNLAFSNGQITDDTIAQHETLYDEYQSLENTLQDLRQEFSLFTRTAG